MKKLTKAMCIAIVSVLILVIVINIFNLPNVLMKKIYPKKYAEYVEYYAEEYDVDELLVYAVIKVESNFNCGVTSKSDAKGLMQVMDSTAREISEKSIFIESYESSMLFDAKTNIQIGIKYLSELIDKYDRKFIYGNCCI